MRTGRTRLRPEVKYATTDWRGQGVRHRLTATADLLVGDFQRIISFPAQGTTDITRIGDTIMGKKLYVRLTIYQNAAADSTTASIFRVIVFNMKVTTATNVALNAFWQTSYPAQAINSIVNREVVNKVFYDKQHYLQSNTSGQSACLKTILININMRWPIVFPGGTQIPKDPRNNIFIAVVGFKTEGVDAALMAQWDVTSNFYFTDA